MDQTIKNCIISFFQPNPVPAKTEATERIAKSTDNTTTTKMEELTKLTDILGNGSITKLGFYNSKNEIINKSKEHFWNYR